MKRHTNFHLAAFAAFVLAAASASAQSKIFQLPATASGDAFGAALARAGDVDGDGYVDLAITSTLGSAGAGYVDLRSGLTGTRIRTLTGASAGEGFGTAVASLGDLDGDGRAELAVGAPLASPNGAGSGRVDVFDGATGSKLHSLDGESAGDHFGFALARLEDVDGDGSADLAIGAVDDDPQGASSGSVRVASGTSGATLYTIGGTAAGQLFGHAIAALDDQDGDGVGDFVVGAPWAPGVQQAGSVRLVSGWNGATLATQSGWFALDGYGTAVANAGDVDGDGLDDLIVGAPQTQGQLRGYVQVWTGGLANLLWDVAGDSNGDAFGAAVAGAGDPDGNGLADFAIGAPGDDDNGNACGALRVLSGISGQAIFTSYGALAGAKLGARLDGGFDASGDGTADLLVAAPGEGNGGAARLVSAKSLALSSDVHTVSLAALGKQNVTLSVDPALFAGLDYTLLGSLTGIAPETPFGGMSLPLAADRYFLYTTRPVKGPMKSARGKLDAAGQASALFDSNVLPKHIPFAGTTFFHAFAVSDSTGQTVFVSNAVPVTILP